jgi:hypothetical protein
VALRILRDEEVLADLYDHFLIREAAEERGRSVAWKPYRRKQAISTRASSLPETVDLELASKLVGEIYLQRWARAF